MTAHISSRWTPGESVRIDTASGAFEHVNARMHNDADSLALQRVLLAQMPEPRIFGINRWAARAPRVRYPLLLLVLLLLIGLGGSIAP